MSDKSLMTLDEVLNAVNGVHILGAQDFYFDDVQTDSRNVKKNTLFVPLIGEFQDGHKYIPQAVKNGASVVFVAKKNYESDSKYFTDISNENPSVVFIAVDNTLYALQNAAEAYVEKFPGLIKIAVTGSSGKTTTKELIADVLRQKYNLISNEGNFNSETGLPLSVFKIRAEHEVGLFEMGMNRKNEIAEIAKVLKPKYAVVTNIGTAHIGLLRSRQNIAEEKSNVFNYLGTDGVAVIPSQDDFCSFLKSKVKGKILCYGKNENPSIHDVTDLGIEGTSFYLNDEKIVLSVPGEYNFINCLAAIALAKELNLSDEQIACGINNHKSMFGRSQVIKGEYTIVQDCYNANPDSMIKSIEFISSVSSTSKKVLVLADMLELGEDSKAEHEKIGSFVNDLIAKNKVFGVVLIGKEMEAAFGAFDKSFVNDRAYYFSNKDDETVNAVTVLLKKLVSKGDIILFKGSRGMALERIVKLLGEVKQ